MKNITEWSLINRWSAKEGFFIDIQEQTNHTLNGILYFKFLTLIKIEFKGVISQVDGIVDFVSFMELENTHYLGNYTIFTHGQASLSDLERGNLHFCISFSMKNGEKMITNSLQMTKTNQSVYELELKSLDFTDIIAEDRNFLN